MPGSLYPRKAPLRSRAGSRDFRIARGHWLPARGWVRLVCFGAAALALLPLAIGAGYWHQDAPGSEATCAICHVAHLTPLPGSGVTLISAPLLIEWCEPAEAQPEQPSPALTNASPRAPPAR